MTVHVALGFLASAALVLPATQRAFAGPVDAPAPSTAAPLIVTGTDDLTAGGPLTPGERRRACVTVSYAGSGDAVVLLVPRVEDDGLAAHLRLEVDEAGADCTPTGAPALLVGDLDDLDARSTRVFVTTTAPTRTYAVTLTAAPALPSGASAGLDLVWSVTH